MCRRCALALMIIFFPPLGVEAGTTYVADTAGEVQSYTNMLQAGDTLLVQPGVYELNWDIEYLTGTPLDWIVISSMGGDVVIKGTAYDNVVDVLNCSYIYFKGFEITTANAGYGIDGIKFKTISDHCTIEDCNIHSLTGVGISANSEDIGYLNCATLPYL